MARRRYLFSSINAELDLCLFVAGVLRSLISGIMAAKGSTVEVVHIKSLAYVPNPPAGK